MQSAKDSFYVALRDRLVLVSPSRVMELRAVQRPGILVEEAEAAMSEIPSDVFVLRWTQAALPEGLPYPLIRMTCEIHYVTSGSAGAVGLDRGRALSEMDREVLSVLRPLCSAKSNYTTNPPTPMLSRVFWTEPVFSALQVVRAQLVRVAAVTVFEFQEASEV